MSAPFVCRCCRQRIQAQRLRIGVDGHRQRRGFISLYAPTNPGATENLGTGTESVNSAKKSRGGTYNGSSEAKVVDGPQQAHSSSSPNDLLQTLFNSGRRDKPKIPTKSRYSNTINASTVKATGYPEMPRSELEANGSSVSGATLVELGWEKLSHAGVNNLSNEIPRWPRSKSSVSSSTLPVSADTQNLRQDQPLDNIRSTTLVTKIRQAIRASDRDMVNQLWTRQLRRMSEPLVRQDSHLQVQLFAEFLRAFFAVGSPDRAIEVWNTMIKTGEKPTVQHWVAMLEGCRKSRDLPSLLSIWQRMKVSNVQLNNYAFTVYLGGLLHAREWQTALEVIEEMGKTWDSIDTSLQRSSIVNFSRPQMDRLEPSIVPVNAAMAGLLNMKRPDLAQAVLQWAETRKIPLNVFTYNTLLRPAVRNDDSEKVQNLLREMNERGCQPDTATFTILLDSYFRNPSSLFSVQTAEEQQAVVDRVFNDMEEHGIEASAYTYGVVLDGLLTSGTFNITAARAVLARMADKGIRHSPHINTILIMHYFSSEPPDLAAIDSLWRRIQLEKLPVDHVFYDRMIEGYAKFEEVDKMLSFLRLMPKAGKTPGWIALLDVLRTLARVEEWELVRDLVRDVVDEGGLLRNGNRGWRGEEEFWEMVEVLRSRGIDLPGPEKIKDVVDEPRPMRQMDAEV